MCVVHTDTALSCILLNNTQHTPVNSLSTLTILWFERKALIQTSVKFALHCTNNDNIICALYIFFSRDYYSYSSYPVTTTDPSAEKWVPISYKVSLLQLSVGEEVLGLEIMVLLQATFLVSNGNNIVTCNLTLFVANDVKGRQVALETDTSDNNTSWTLKPGHQKY